MLTEADYENPHVVIIDLGLSQGFFPKTPGVQGTPGYIPPETWSKKQWFPVGDVFSMGVVCLQMLTGKIPDQSFAQEGIFTEGCTTLAQVSCVTRMRNPPIQMAWPQSPELLALLEGCLEKDRVKRLHSPQVLQMPWISRPLPSQNDAPTPRLTSRDQSEKGSSFSFACCVRR